jgi:uncharacterized protein YbbC (DUF1343 family)/beta-glucosidase-like glycosyl hydrolase
VNKILLILLLLFNNLFAQINVGQRFILTLPVDTSRQNLKNWISKTKPAGVMLLYHSNSRQDIKELIDFLQIEAKNLGLPKLFITIDWEGGIVSRVHESSGFSSVPSPLNLAKAGRTYSFLAGKLIGQQCADVGINMNFAPSLDIFNKNNPVLASRPFSDNSKIVLEYATAFCGGLKSENVIPVTKHFPGLGLGVDDTHFESVKITPEKKLFDEHLFPFKELLKEKYPAVMSTHASFPNFFEDLPTTLSSKAVDFIKNVNKKALLITDDFWMGGVRNGRSLLDITMQSLKAGQHLIILSARKGEDIELIEALQKRVDNLSSQEKRKFAENINFINSYKNKKIYKSNKAPILSEKKVAKLLAQKSIKEFHANLNLKNELSSKLNFNISPKITSKVLAKMDKKNILISVDLPKLRPSEGWFVEKGFTYLGQKLKELNLGINEIVFNAKDESDIERALNLLKENISEDKNLILQTFFYGASVSNSLQKRLLEGLKSYEEQLTIISLGHPLEQTVLPNAKIFNLGSFSRPMLNEVAKRLVKNKVPKNDFSVKKLLSELKNKKVGLLCHAASRVNFKGKEYFLPDFLKDNVNLKALFSPEHGLLGNHDAAANINSNNSSKWGCPIYSLHGQHKKPTPKMLEGLDLMVVDLHEVGIRAFTYLSSLDLVMQAAKENNLPILVVDHVNPIYFWKSQGPRLKEGYKSFVGRVDVPFIHGKSIGRIAKQINKNLQVDLKVLPTLSKNKSKYYLKYNKYIATSPNLPELENVYAYPLTVFIEGTNYSEGRGTEFPFQQVGAPWVDGKKIAKILNSKKLPGIYFEPVQFKPISIQGKSSNSKHQDKLCGGVFLHFYDLKNVQPIKTAQAIIKILFNEYPKESVKIQFAGKNFINHLVGDDSIKNGFVKNYYDKSFILSLNN